MTTKEQVMREWILRQVGCGYIYGATGWICSLSRRKAQAEQYPAYADAIMTTGAKWDGKACYDCAQLTRRAMEQVGLKPPSGAASQYKSAVLYQGGGTIDQLPAGKLAQLFRVSADGSVPHTGWAIGDGTAVDARGHKDGVIRMAIDMVDRFLPEGTISVGQKVEITHTAPSLLGVHVHYRIVLTGIDGNHLHFTFVGWDGLGEVCHGRHERVVVSREALVRKAQERAGFLAEA